ncbi:MAG: hypothetical protein E6I07_12505, partial [Chloroflexi bacterium]
MSSNARESCDSWLKTFCWAKIPSPFVTAFRFLRVRPKTEDRSPQTVKITFCVRGVLSPLLSNLVLDELDRELERRKHRFVRYADDCNIYVASERAGKRVMQSVTGFLRRRLKLKVNEAKSAVARPQERKFLGFSFTGRREPKRRIAPKPLLRCKRRVRELTRRTRGISLEQMLKELASYLRGWKGYFGYCQTPSVLRRLEEWIRRRLRSVIWKQWKRSKVRYVRLRQRTSDMTSRHKPPAVPMAPGAWPTARLCSPPFRLLTSTRAVFPGCWTSSSLTELNRRMRTRMY